MLNAGLIPLIVVDQHKAVFWKQVFPKIQVHDNVVLRDGGNIARRYAKDSPQLLAVLNNFVKKNRQGTTLGNTLLLRYLKNAKYVKNAAASKERRKFLAMVDVFRKYGDRYDVDWLLMAARGDTRVAAESVGTEPRRRHRRYAGDAQHWKRAEGGRY